MFNRMQTISCFSYKGGAGRSTLAINVVPFLADELGASADHPLILVDMDIDSCGLTYLFGLDKSIHDTYNVQALFGTKSIPERQSNSTIATHPLFNNLPCVGNYFGLEDNKAILCLPAKPGESLNGSNNYDGPDNKFQSFIRLCNDLGCCGVLLDSSVGNQLTASWSNSAATHIMCCLRPTKQFREGTKRFFDEFDEDFGSKKIIVIPNVVPTDSLDLTDGATVRHYPDYAREQIIEAFSENRDNGDNEYILDLVEGDIFGIPKIDRFMWQEGVLNNAQKDTLNDFERSAIKQYKKIAAIIKNS